MGFTEMLFLAFIGYLLLGPKKTSELAREIGQHVMQVKRAANELQEQLLAETLPPEAMGAESVNTMRQSIVGSLAPGLKVKDEAVTANAVALPTSEADMPVPDLLTDSNCTSAVVN